MYFHMAAEITPVDVSESWIINARAMFTKWSQPLNAASSSTHTESPEVWPASSNGLQASVTEASRLLAERHEVKTCPVIQ